MKYNTLNVFNFHQLLFNAHRSSHRYNSGTHVNAATWRMVHEHIVADAFLSNKSSSTLLVHEQQTSQK